QKSPRRHVAVKVLRNLLVDPGARRRFEREAEFLGRLTHPGIAQVIESGRVDDEIGTDYIALEYVDGLQITDYAEEQELDRDARIRLIIELCQAAQHAHSLGVVHRDLKPGNVLVTREGRIKVIDFGIARAVGADEQLSQQTQAGQIIGTLSYMSPEQISGDSTAIDMRSDVYSIGVMAFELLAGSLPRDYSTESLAQIVEQLTKGRAPSLGAVAPHCRGDLDLIVSKALDPERERRYQSAAELATDLQRLLDFEPIHARPV
ncbi:MAG: serine/threonine protein kinase, partial [bacterium]|nr:serine/threonine protein kinase [bacterium]